MPRQSRSAIRCHDALFHILFRETLSLPTNNLTDGDGDGDGEELEEDEEDESEREREGYEDEYDEDGDGDGDGEEEGGYDYDDGSSYEYPDEGETPLTNPEMSRAASSAPGGSADDALVLSDSD